MRKKYRMCHSEFLSWNKLRRIQKLNNIEGGANENKKMVLAIATMCKKSSCFINNQFIVAEKIV